MTKNELTPELPRWADRLVMGALTAVVELLLLAGGASGANLPPLLVPLTDNPVVANPANKDRRVALVIGNAAYPGIEGRAGWPALTTPVKDLKLIADALAADGFEVTTLPDGRHDDIVRKIAQFETDTAGSRVSVIYYAGHGFEYAGRNYLVPVDAPVTVTAAELPYRFVDLDQIVSNAGQANWLNLFFLDACRTPDPVVTIADASGTGAPHTSVDLDLPPQSTYLPPQIAVFYSTARGEPAFDHVPPQFGNSPFAINVAAMLKAPHINLANFFGDVTWEVEQQTLHLDPIQQPYVYATVHSDFYFREAEPSFPVSASGTGGAPPPPVHASEPKANAAPHLMISDEDLQTIDEPVLAARVLRQYTPKQVEAMAEGGDPLATYLLGYFYEFGVGVPIDLTKARDWLVRAAHTHHPSGELELGYYVEQHEPNSQALSLYLYEEAAAQKDAKAQAHLAYALMKLAEGKSDALRDREEARAVSLYREAANAGYPNAMYQLAMIGLDPQRTDNLRFKVNTDQEVADLRNIAAAGNMDGRRYLCEIADARGQTDIDDCKLAAQAGFASAQAHLAVYYHDGRSPAPKSDYEARHWTRLALSQDPKQDPYFTPVLQARLKGFQYPASEH